MAEPAPRDIKLKLASLSSILLKQQLQSLILDQLNKLNFMNKKLPKRNIQTPELAKLSYGMNKIQQTLHYEQSLCADQNCLCEVCKSKKSVLRVKIKSYFQQGSQNSDKWLLKVLTGLSSRDAPTLKMYIHDISFVEGQLLKVFYTDTKDGRIKKSQGSTPTKNIFLTMLRLKKLYKEMLEQKFQRKLLSEINPQFIHQKYMEHVIPSHFTDSEDSNRLNINKTQFMKYVLHKDQKFLIQSIEEHKLNQNEPFCSIRYKDGNMQLLSKRQFQAFTLLKIPNDVSYVQSYIKQKQQTKAHYTSCYSFLSNQTNTQLFDRAEKQVLVLIGGLGKYSQSYEDLEVFQDSAIELMKNNIQEYIDYSTYRIVHYLAMVSRIYVKHIKINWVLNDINMVYFQNVFEFEITQLCLRTLKYRVPPKEQNLVFYKDSQNFITLYKQIQILRENKRKTIRNKILQQRKKQQQQQDKNQISIQKSEYSTIDPQKSARASINKNRIKLSSVSKTISTYAHNSASKEQYQMNAKQLQDRYYKSKEGVRLSQFEKRKKRNFSVVDKYFF